MHTRQTFNHQLTQESRFLLPVELGGSLRHSVFHFVERKVDALDAEVGRVCVHGVGVVVVGGNAGRTSGGWVSAFDAAVIGLGEIVARAIDASAPCQPARQQDEHGPEGDEEQEEVVVHGLLLATREQNEAVDEQRDADDIEKDAKGEWERVHGSVLKQGAKRPEEAAYCEEAHDAQEVEEEVGHGLGLGTRRASFHKRFESHLAFGEIANGKHELRRNSVVSHLGDAARRDAESISERFGSAALTFEPCLEIHGVSLEQPKRTRQAFSKPRLFMLG